MGFLGAYSKVAIGDTIKLQALGKQPVTVTVRERDEQGNVTGECELITHRNTWEVEKSESHTILDAVASKIVKDKVHDPLMAQKLIDNIHKEIQKQAEINSLPQVYCYDNNVPIKYKQPQQSKKEQTMEKSLN